MFYFLATIKIDTSTQQEQCAVQIHLEEHVPRYVEHKHMCRQIHTQAPKRHIVCNHSLEWGC